MVDGLVDESRLSLGNVSRLASGCAATNPLAKSVSIERSIKSAGVRGMGLWKFPLVAIQGLRSNEVGVENRLIFNDSPT